MEVALEELIPGIHRFHPEEFRSSHNLFATATRSGGPEALVITCSELAIDPYNLIPTNVDDLDILQNFGNCVSPYGDALAFGASAVEYALAIYTVKYILI
jgi:carbonic anhydrase